jgi:hypothetical protein
MFWSLHCELSCVLRLIIVRAAKFAMLSSFFMVKHECCGNLLCAVYGQNAVSQGTVRQWCRMFKDGRTDVHIEELCGRPSVVSDYLVQNVDQNL